LHKWHARGRHAGTFTTPVDYICHDGDLVEEDEEEIILALERRERVRYIRLVIPVLNLQTLIVAIDEECPTLEYLILLEPPNEEDNTALTVYFPKHFKLHIYATSRCSTSAFRLDLDHLSLLWASLHPVLL
jgi:hypothetical protein